MRNRFLLLKCIALGALSFPSPILLFLYTFDLPPIQPDPFLRLNLMIFLMLAGGLIGLAYYYRDEAIAHLKDWYPSDRE